MDMLSKSPMMNQSSMMGMMKNNLMMMILMPLQYAWVSHFFSGFIIGKVPFPLTQKFREMLQKGIDVNDLDVKYISSISLYFICLIGIDKVLALLKNDKKISDASMNQMQTMGMPPTMQNQSPFQAAQSSGDIKTKQFKSECENLKMIDHFFLLNNADILLNNKL